MSELWGDVLVVEDDVAMRTFLRATLTGLGMDVLEVGTRDDAARVMTAQLPKLVLLDLGLPDGDGVDLVRTVREWSQVPIIVISARGREADKVTALDAGADDYLTKPFGTGELVARIKVALRHGRAVAGIAREPVTEIGPIRIDEARHEVSVDGAPVHLTPIEFKLLARLALHAGRVITHRQLLREVWGPRAVEQIHYLRVHMAALRRKIERDPARPQWLVTEPGVGYRLREA